MEFASDPTRILGSVGGWFVASIGKLEADFQIS